MNNILEKIKTYIELNSSKTCIIVDEHSNCKKLECCVSHNLSLDMDSIINRRFLHNSLETDQDIVAEDIATFLISYSVKDNVFLKDMYKLHVVDEDHSKVHFGLFYYEKD